MSTLILVGLKQGKTRSSLNFTQKIENLVGISCGAQHIILKSTKTTHDILAIDVEAAARNIFLFSYKYTIKIYKMKIFVQLLSQTIKLYLAAKGYYFCWLLSKLNLFEALKEFIEAELDYPTFLAKFFEDPCSKL